MSNSEVRTEPVASARFRDDAKIRILYELLIIIIIDISQMKQSCADFVV